MKRPSCSSPTPVMSAAFRPEPRRADGDVRRAAADRLGEARDVLQPRADLLAVEIDRGAADGDDVEGGGASPVSGIIRSRIPLDSSRGCAFRENETSVPTDGQFRIFIPHRGGENMLRFGLLGAGRIGKIHGGNIAASPKAKLVAVADVDTKAARGARQGARRGGARPPTRSSRADDIDAMLIGTPTDTHADLIEAGGPRRARRCSARSRSTSTRSGSRRASRWSRRRACR